MSQPFPSHNLLEALAQRRSRPMSEPTLPEEIEEMLAALHRARRTVLAINLRAAITAALAAERERVLQYLLDGGEIDGLKDPEGWVRDTMRAIEEAP